MLGERDADSEIDSSILLQYFARELRAGDGYRNDWLQMLAQAIQMRALVVVLDGPDAERDDGGVAAELLDVAVDARVLADGHRVLLGRRVGVVRVDPLLHDDCAGAVVECVHLVGGGVGGLDDLAEEGDVVDLLAVDAKALVLYVSGGAARLAENRQCLCSLQLGSKTQLCGFEIAGWIWDWKGRVD